MTDILSLLRCPVCGGELVRADRSLRCAAGHAYDLARAGYVNLLPPGKQKNARTGDEDAMVRARTAFLARGFYDPIDTLTADSLAAYGRTGGGERIFADLGAGEGWHTCRTAELLGARAGVPVLGLGFDASKFAAESACRLARSKGFFDRDAIGGGFEAPVRAACLPANIFRLPVPDGVFHAALSMFAPVPWEEARRILSPGGLLAVVSAGREHLYELRSALYDEVRLADRVPEPPAELGFAEKARLPLRFVFEPGESLPDLFGMTPFSRKTGAEGRTRLLSRTDMKITASVLLSLFEV